MWRARYLFAIIVLLIDYRGIMQNDEPMLNPVMAADGHTYESSWIARWLKNHTTHPITIAGRRGKATSQCEAEEASGTGKQDPVVHDEQ